MTLPPSADSLARTLVAASPDLALDATITPETLARIEDSARGVPVAEARITRTPLPRVSIAQGTHPSGDVDAGSTADFEVVGTLGEGGMGRVLLAHQRSVGRDVAIKVPKDRERGSEPLRVEGLTMGRLEHPSIVPVHAVGVDDHGGLVLVMKRVEGVEWRALLADPQHPRWTELELAEGERLAFHVEVLTQVANALEFAHARGIYHRDLKPENVLVGALGEVYLADWGIASLPPDRQAGGAPRIVGTPVYMAPEMVVGDPSRVTARTDVYLLGATLHEVLTGEPRHAGRTLQEVLLAALRSEPKAYPPEVPAELAALAQRATDPDPEARPASALAFRRALDSWRTHRGSLELTRSSRAVLESLRARVVRASLSPEEPATLREMDRGLVEARFGFSQALREWPENADARAGLREALVLSVAHELRREGLEAARALLSEIDDPPAMLVADVDALEAELAKKKDEQSRLRALAQDLDVGVGSKERRGLLALITVLGVCMSAYVAWTGMSGDPEILATRALGFSGGLFTVGVLGALTQRKRVAGNEAGRRLLILVMSALGGLFVHRALMLLAGAPIHVMLVGDLVLYGAILAAGSALRRKFVILCVPVLLSALVAALVPVLSAAAFSVGTLSILFALVLRWRWFMETD